MSWSRAARRTIGTGGRGGIHGPQGVVPQVLARDLVLGDAALRGEVGRDRGQQPGVAQQPKADRRRGRAEQLVELGRDPLARQVGDELGPCLDPGQRRRLHPELERGREPDGTDHPQRVLLESVARLADGSQDPGADVEDAAVRVHEGRRLAGACAPGHRVDREVAPGEVELDRVAELDAVRSAEVGVVVVGPERRDLEDLAVAADGDRPEPVLVDGAREGLEELFRASARREVPVERLAAQHEVAQRTADEVRRVPGLPERAEQAVDRTRDRLPDVGRRPRQLRPRNRYDRHASLCSSARYGVNSE